MKKNEKRNVGFDTFENYNLMYRWKCLLSKKMLTQWIYLFFPFIITISIFVIMYCEGVLLSTQGKTMFSFLRDISNSICMTTLFVVSYFLSGHYSLWMKDAIGAVKQFQNSDNTDKVIEKILYFIKYFMWLSLLFCLLGIPFANVASNQKEAWAYVISSSANFVYSFYLSMTWYMSINLILYSFVTAYLIFYITKRTSFNLFGSNYSYERINRTIGRTKKALGRTFTFSVFWVAGAIVMIINDYSNIRFGVHMMFYDYPIVAVVVIICIMFAGLYIMIPMFELKQIVHIQKEIEMVNIDKIPNENERIRKINELDKISESIFGDSVNKLLMIISIIMPIATLIFQTLL